MDLNLWKNKDELKKFLENLGVEYRYGCFEENNPETCHLLGDYLLSIDKAQTKAAQIYRSNCEDNKYGLSCDAFGRMAFKGQSIEGGPNYKLALDYFLRGCELNEPRSCYHGGQMLGIQDKGINSIIEPDPERSLSMLKKACDSGKQPASCTLIHSFYLKGFQGKPADLKEAARFASIACDQNEFIACYNLSRMYHLGEGVSADIERANFYQKRAKEVREGAKKNVQANPDVKSVV